MIINFALAMMAIVNPFGIIPIWSELTGDEEVKVQHEIAILATLTSLVILLIFLLFGRFILHIFHIDINAFQLAGGILLFITGLKMIYGEETKLKKQKEDGHNTFDIAKKRFGKIIVPLTFPMIAGPGTLTTVLIYGNKSESIINYIALVVIAILIMVILFFFFFYSNWLNKKIDKVIYKVFTHIFGLLIAAVAVQLIIEAVKEIFPVLK